MQTPDDCPARRLKLAAALWNWIPHPSQRDFLADPHPVKVAACGRRWGKSIGVSIDLATFAIAHEGTTQMVVSPTYDQSRIIFAALRRRAAHPLISPESDVVSTPHPQVRIGNSTILIRTAGDDGRNLRGHAAHRVVVDEAAYVKEEIVTEVIGPMLADTGGALILISTPFGRNHFYRTYLTGLADAKDRNPRVRSWNCTTLDNPHISREYVEAQRHEMSDRQFRCEYLAEFIDDAACVFRWDDIAAAATAEFQPPQPGRHYLAGCDLGKYRDYSALCVIDISEPRARVVSFARFNRLPWPDQRARILDALQSYAMPPLVIDSTGLGDPVADELEREGVLCLRYGFTAESKRRLIDNLSLRMSLRQIAFPPIRPLVEELQYFEYEMTPAGQVRYQGRGHDDCVIALALAVWGARATPSPPFAAAAVAR
jgi:hypothetical protein